MLGTVGGPEDRCLWGGFPFTSPICSPAQGALALGPYLALPTSHWPGPLSCPIPMQEPCSLVPFCSRTRMGLNSGSTAYDLCDPGEVVNLPEPPA